MATANVSEQNQRASDWSARFGTATLVIANGATPLATHTLTGFGAPAAGVITGNTIADAPIANTATANTATLTSGANVYTLTVGLSGSGADVIVSNTSYVAGETSSITALTVTFPAT